MILASMMPSRIKVIRQSAIPFTIRNFQQSGKPQFLVERKARLVYFASKNTPYLMSVQPDSHLINISQFFFLLLPFYCLRLFQTGMSRLIHTTRTKYTLVIAKSLTLLRYLVSYYVYLRIGKQYPYPKILKVSTNT